MKSTYKLLGDFWDQLPVPSVEPNVVLCSFAETSDLIYLSDILKIQHPDNLLSDDISNNLKLLIDFFPKTNSTIIHQYYIKRLLQIAKAVYPTDSIINLYIGDVENYKRIKPLITNFYKEQAPYRMLAQSDGACQVIC